MGHLRHEVACRTIERGHVHVAERRGQRVTPPGVGERGDAERVRCDEAPSQGLAAGASHDAGDEAERDVGAQEGETTLALHARERETSVAEGIGRDGERRALHRPHSHEHQVADAIDLAKLDDEDLSVGSEAAGRRDGERRGNAERSAVKVDLDPGEERETRWDRRGEVCLRQRREEDGEVLDDRAAGNDELCVGCRRGATSRANDRAARCATVERHRNR